MVYRFLKKPLCHKIETIKRILWVFKIRYYGSYGKFSLIDRPLMLYNRKNIFIGKHVMIRPNIRIEPVKEWLGEKFSPLINIGDYTSIEQNCHITCANKVTIGKYVTILGYSCITDIDHEYKDIKKGILQQPIIVKTTSIGDESFIGMGSRIMAGVHIGRHCIIGANSVVNKDVPDYSVVGGIPAKVIKRYNVETDIWEKID
ncbi:MAG: acyltransferase [Clostridium sp.]|uniref:acyltransferase n=1 Tax=Clostridium sp. TaxID=1506 RepID=UPI003D6D7E39